MIKILFKFKVAYSMTPKMDYCFSESSKSIKPRTYGIHEGKIVGFYTQRERRNKIFHFKNKNMRRKFFVPVVKEFEGRSNSARIKPRKGGRFVKSELGHLYTLTEEQKMKRTRTIDFHISNDDYESAVTFLIEY